MIVIKYGVIKPKAFNLHIDVSKCEGSEPRINSQALEFAFISWVSHFSFVVFVDRYFFWDLWNGPAGFGVNISAFLSLEEIKFEKVILELVVCEAAVVVVSVQNRVEKSGVALPKAELEVCVDFGSVKGPA